MTSDQTDRTEADGVACRLLARTATVVDPAKTAGHDAAILVPRRQGRAHASPQAHRGPDRGIQRMVDDDEYCIDILTQISASTKGLQAVALNLLEGHLAHCVAEAQTSGDPAAAEAKVKEASNAVARLLRT